MTPWLCAFDAFTSLLYAPHTLTRTLPQITNLNSLQLSLYITSKIRQYIIKSALSEMAMQGFDYRSFKSLCVSKERPFESGQNQWYFPSRVSLRFSAVRRWCTRGCPSPLPPWDRCDCTFCFFFLSFWSRGGGEGVTEGQVVTEVLKRRQR